LTFPGLGSNPRVQQLDHLSVSPHEWGLVAFPALSEFLSNADGRPDRNCAQLPLEDDISALAILDSPSGESHGLSAGQYLPGLGGRLEARSGIQSIPGHGYILPA
jgi:hypothetical protein